MVTAKTNFLYNSRTMASSSTPHYFLPGRKSKNEGPGILVVHGMYKFRLNNLDNP